MNDPLILVRFVHLAATVLAAGTVCFTVLVVDLAPLRRQLSLLAGAALAVAVLSGAAWLVLIASDILGASVADVCLQGGIWSVAADTRFGQIWGARLALALILAVLLWRQTMPALQLTAAAGLTGLPAFVGHAGATLGRLGDLHLASDIAHLLAASAWLGGLPALAMLLAQARRAGGPARETIVPRAIRRFSLIGIVCVATLVVSGSINAWVLLSSPRDLLGTGYGRLLVLKIGLFAAMVAIAAVNRFHLTPRLAAPETMQALRRNSLAEAGLGLAVLVLVGALGTLPPSGHVHGATPEAPPDAAFVHLHDAIAMADVTIDPGRAGRVNVTVRLSREDFSDFAAKSVSIALDPPAGSGPALRRDAVPAPDGTWQVHGLEIRQPGIWLIKIAVTPENGASFVLDGPIVIE